MNKIVCLCGSTKFKEEFEQVNRNFTLKGYIVLAPGVFQYSDNVQLDGTTKQQLDELHKRKIDMADEVHCIDVKGYIDESTKSELEYAKSKHKIITFYSKPELIIDEVGGTHDCAIGWNPNGVWCGECTRISCKNCSARYVVDDNL